MTNATNTLHTPEDILAALQSLPEGDPRRMEMAQDADIGYRARVAKLVELERAYESVRSILREVSTPHPGMF